MVCKSFPLREKLYIIDNRDVHAYILESQNRNTKDTIEYF